MLLTRLKSSKWMTCKCVAIRIKQQRRNNFFIYLTIYASINKTKTNESNYISGRHSIIIRSHLKLHCPDSMSIGNPLIVYVSACIYEHLSIRFSKILFRLDVSVHIYSWCRWINNRWSFFFFVFLLHFFFFNRDNRLRPCNELSIRIKSGYHMNRTNKRKNKGKNMKIHQNMDE